MYVLWRRNVSIDINKKDTKKTYYRMSYIRYSPTCSILSRTVLSAVALLNGGMRWIYTAPDNHYYVTESRPKNE
jgi:hypothetical protein